MYFVSISLREANVIKPKTYRYKIPKFKHTFSRKVNVINNTPSMAEDKAYTHSIWITLLKHIYYKHIGMLPLLTNDLSVTTLNDSRDYICMYISSIYDFV